MRLSYFPKYAARNAAPVIESFLQGARYHGISCHQDCRDSDAVLIWSQLWAGRMRHNLAIYQHYRQLGKPVIMIDVGLIQRNHTWRISLDGDAYLAGTGHSAARAQEFGIMCRPWTQRGRDIVLALQRSDSNQWNSMPDPKIWLKHTVAEIQAHTHRPIVIRSHPRAPLTWHPENTVLVAPKHLPGTYDDFDFPHCLHNAWAVVNWNSTPGILSVIHGVPAFVGPSSLARPVANTDLALIETPGRPDREQWVNDLAWTEWTVEEIRRGEPQKFLLDLLHH